MSYRLLRRPSDPHDAPAQLSVWRGLLSLLGGRRGPVIGLVAASFLTGLTESSILAIVAQAAAALVDRERLVPISVGPLHVTGTLGGLLAAGFGLALIRLVLQAPVSVLPARIAGDVQARLRLGLFSAFAHASWSAQARDREGELQELMTNQVAMASLGAIQATSLVTGGIMLFVLIASALLLNILAAVTVLGAAVVIALLLRPLNALGARQARALSQAQMNYASGVGEATRLAEETHVFGVADAQCGRVAGLVITARSLFVRTQTLGRAIPNVYQSVTYLVVVGGLFALHATHATQVASLGAVVLLLVRAGTYGQQLQGSYQFVRQSVPYIDRLRLSEQRYVESTAPSGSRRLGPLRSLAFEHVSFAYTPDRPVLVDISFEVQHGEAVGVVGPSGAGKSTLVQLILQLRTATHGRYLVNGEPADELVRDDWHARVAYVPQEPRLLHATVADNIRFYRGMDDAAVERAARLARIHDDIVAWPLGYDTVIGPRADAVSGGQQQRICIARALAGHPDVLVLDEPTSALDPRSESLLQESLRTLKAEITLLVVAHRMSTLDLCDRVMVVIDGRVEAFEPTAVLKRQSAYYREALALAAGEHASDSSPNMTNVPT